MLCMYILFYICAWINFVDFTRDRVLYMRIVLKCASRLLMTEFDRPRQDGRTLTSTYCCFSLQNPVPSPHSGFSAGNV